jgi:hypothetical protein
MGFLYPWHSLAKRIKEGLLTLHSQIENLLLNFGYIPAGWHSQGLEEWNIIGLSDACCYVQKKFCVRKCEEIKWGAVWRCQKAGKVNDIEAGIGQ